MISELSFTLSQMVVWVSQNRSAILLASCLILGGAGALVMAGMPFRESLLDIPNDRSSHHAPIPRGGGIGILVAFLVAGISLRLPTTFLFSAILVSLVSFYGDFLRISVKFRLYVQILAALIFLFPLLPRLTAYYAEFSGESSPVFIVFLLPILLFYLIGTTNFYNFMDGIDGMAGLSGFIAFTLLGTYTLYSLPPPDVLTTSLAWLSLCIALACLGFLPFNVPRARVFMGDVGSILLGFVFAAMVISTARNFREILFFTACLFPFYADELSTMSIRLVNRENLFSSHRRHLYQILANEAGFAHWKITAIYGLVQIAIAAGVFMVMQKDYWVIILFLTGCSAAFTALGFCVRKKYSSIVIKRIRGNILNGSSSCCQGKHEI